SLVFIDPPATVVYLLSLHDALPICYFMTIPEACRLVLEAAFMGQGNDIFIFDMGKPVKITDMACRMIKLAGLQPDKDIEIVYTGDRKSTRLNSSHVSISYAVFCLKK